MYRYVYYHVTTLSFRMDTRLERLCQLMVWIYSGRNVVLTIYIDELNQTKTRLNYMYKKCFMVNCSNFNQAAALPCKSMSRHLAFVFGWHYRVLNEQVTFEMKTVWSYNTHKHNNEHLIILYITIEESCTAIESVTLYIKSFNYTQDIRYCFDWMFHLTNT